MSALFDKVADIVVTDADYPKVQQFAEYSFSETRREYLDEIARVRQERINNKTERRRLSR